MLARRYELYVLMARTISHSFAALTHEILFLPLEHKIHIFSPPCNILYVLGNLCHPQLFSFRFDLFLPQVFSSLEQDHFKVLRQFFIIQIGIWLYRLHYSSSPQQIEEHRASAVGAHVKGDHLILNLNWLLHLLLENEVKMSSKRGVVSLIFVIKCISKCFLLRNSLQPWLNDSIP